MNISHHHYHFWKVCFRLSGLHISVKPPNAASRPTLCFISENALRLFSLHAEINQSTVFLHSQCHVHEMLKIDFYQKWAFCIGLSHFFLKTSFRRISPRNVCHSQSKRLLFQKWSFRLNRTTPFFIIKKRGAHYGTVWSLFDFWSNGTIVKPLFIGLIKRGLTMVPFEHFALNRLL